MFGIWIHLIEILIWLLFEFSQFFFSSSFHMNKVFVNNYHSPAIKPHTWFEWNVSKSFEFWHDVAIEKELETAIFKVGGIRDSNYGDLDKISWGRSSRTDKGVSRQPSCYPLSYIFHKFVIILFLRVIISLCFYDVLVLGPFSVNNAIF